MVTEPAVPLPEPGAAKPAEMSEACTKVLRAMHKTIAGVADDLDRFAFNKAVARIREFTNQLDALGAEEVGAAWMLREGLETLVRLIGPMTPHLGEELWQALGHGTLLVDTAWPEFDPALLKEDTVTLAVQVNGALRGTLEFAKDAAKEDIEAAALAIPNVAKAMDGKPARKVIVVPNRIVNVVV